MDWSIGQSLSRQSEITLSDVHTQLVKKMIYHAIHVASHVTPHRGTGGGARGQAAARRAI